MVILQVIICLLIGYLAGTFLPAALLSKKIKGKDISEIGSGNPGMANVMANIGKREGALVLAGDVLKVAAACLIAWLLTWDMQLKEVVRWTGFSAILGHDFPVWRHFRGGKGVAVTCTWLVFSMPIWGSISCAVGGIVTLATGYLPLGSVLIPLLAIIPSFVFCGTAFGILVCLSFAVMVMRNRTGLINIFKGSEKKRFRR